MSWKIKKVIILLIMNIKLKSRFNNFYSNIIYTFVLFKACKIVNKKIHKKDLKLFYFVNNYVNNHLEIINSCWFYKKNILLKLE